MTLHERVQRWPKGIRALLLLGELRPLLALAVSLFWSLFGGAVMLVIMRAIVVTRLDAQIAQERRDQSGDSTHLATVNVTVQYVIAQIDSIKAEGAIEHRAICLDHTVTEQETLGMVCPAHLHRGAR